MTPYQAAQNLVSWLKERGYVDAVAYDKEKVEQMGWCKADAQVGCEGADLVGLQMEERHGPFKGCSQPFPGVFCEPYSSWLMCFYKE